MCVKTDWQKTLGPLMSWFHNMSCYHQVDNTGFLSVDWPGLKTLLSLSQLMFLINNANRHQLGLFHTHILYVSFVLFVNLCIYICICHTESIPVLCICNWSCMAILSMGPAGLCCQCLLFIMHYVLCPVLVDECLLLSNTLMIPTQISPWGH